MIPYLPQNSSDEDMLRFYDSIVDNLKIRSAHHESWHTHRRDTSVCWICDLVEVATIMRSEMERVISKSALDLDDSSIVQELSSEEETVNTQEDN